MVIVNAERQMISIFSWYYFGEENKDTYLSHWNKVTWKIQHKDVLGKYLSWELFEKGGGYWFLNIHCSPFQDISDYVLFNKKVKRENVSEIYSQKWSLIDKSGVYKDIIASSMFSCYNKWSL